MKPTLVILAAGAGSRYGGLKQLAAIGPAGEALFEYSAYDARRAGFSRVVLVVRPEQEPAFRTRLVEMVRQMPVRFAHQTLDALPPGFSRPPGRARPWGTGQAVLAAEPEIEGAFAVVNADDFYGAESFDLQARFLTRAQAASEPRLAMVGFEIGGTLSAAGPVARALCHLDDRGLLREIVELKRVWRHRGRIVYGDAEDVETLDGDELASMNFWGFTPELFPELRRSFEAFLARMGDIEDAEFQLPDVIRHLVREDRARVEVLRGAGRWCGITFREDEERVAGIISTLIEQGRYPRELWA